MSTGIHIARLAAYHLAYNTWTFLVCLKYMPADSNQPKIGEGSGFQVRDLMYEVEKSSLVVSDAKIPPEARCTVAEAG